MKIGSNFGSNIYLTETYAIIGEQKFDSENKSDSGTAHIFIKDSLGKWIHSEQLVSNDSRQGDNFGNSVSIDGNHAIVGAYHRDFINSSDIVSTDGGVAYIFQKDADGWQQQKKISVNDIEEDDNFGISVSIKGNYAVIGSFNDDSIVFQEPVDNSSQPEPYTSSGRLTT